jgi:two-component system CheB/CheR fusion protein
MVIVDKDLRVTLFSPLAVRVFGLVSADIGHPLIGIPTTVPIHDLRQTLLSVVLEGRSCTLQALSEENSYLLQLTPYRNSQGQILGVIMTMTDVSELVALRRLAEASLQEFEDLTDAIDQVVWKRDCLSNKILYISARIQDLTGWKASEVVALPDLLDSAIVPADRAAVLAAREAGTAGWNVIYSLNLRDGSRRTMREVGIPLEDASSDHAVVGTLIDITEHQQQASQLRFLQTSFQTLIESVPQPTALLDPDLHVVWINPAFARTLQPLAQTPGEITLDILATQLVPLDPATSAATGSLEEVLRTAAQQAGARSFAVVQLPVALPHGERPGEGRTLEVVPIPHDPEAPGLLLRLRDPGPAQGQSSSTPPSAG